VRIYHKKHPIPPGYFAGEWRKQNLLIFALIAEGYNNFKIKSLKLCRRIIKMNLFVLNILRELLGRYEKINAQKNHG
jgi:hypothetical protein